MSDNRSTTKPSTVQTGQQFHGCGHHTRAHVRMLTLLIAASFQRWCRSRDRNRLVIIGRRFAEGQQSGGAWRRRVFMCRWPDNAATATTAYFVVGRQRLRMRLSLLRATRGRPPYRRPQIGSHFANTRVPPHSGTSSAVVSCSAHVVAVGRHATRVTQRPRPVFRRERRVATTATAAASAPVAATAPGHTVIVGSTKTTNKQRSKVPATTPVRRKF